MITSRHIITLTFGPFNYNIHRKIALQQLEGYTKSQYKGITEMVLHFKGDYDERYKCGKHYRNIEKILLKLLTIFNINFKFFQVPDKKLKKFTTVKTDVKKGVFKRPDDEFTTNVPESFSALNFDVDVDTNERPSTYVNREFKKEGDPDRNEAAKKDDEEEKKGDDDDNAAAKQAALDAEAKTAEAKAADSKAADSSASDSKVADSSAADSKASAAAAAMAGAAA